MLQVGTWDIVFLNSVIKFPSKPPHSVLVFENNESSSSSLSEVIIILLIIIP